MSYVGKWVFHSIASTDENDNFVYLSAEEFLKSPMSYIDETDEDEVQNELQERKNMISAQLKICDDGNMYMLMPIPEGVTQEEVDEAVSAGEIKLVDGMMTDSPSKWEERNGEFWYDTGIEGEVFGEKADSWVKASDDEGFISIFTTRYTKAV